MRQHLHLLGISENEQRTADAFRPATARNEIVLRSKMTLWRADRKSVGVKVGPDWYGYLVVGFLGREPGNERLKDEQA